MVVLKLALKVGSDFNLWGCKGSRFQVTGKQWCISQAWLLLGLNESLLFTKQCASCCIKVKTSCPIGSYRLVIIIIITSHYTAFTVYQGCSRCFTYIHQSILKKYSVRCVQLLALPFYKSRKQCLEWLQFVHCLPNNKQLSQDLNQTIWLRNPKLEPYKGTTDQKEHKVGRGWP